MQTIKPEFTEKETLIGYIETDSGTLLLSDGIWASSFPLTTQQSLSLDIGDERKSFPVYTIMRGGQRFLLIALDSNAVSTPIPPDEEQVVVDQPLTDDEIADRTSDGE
jgi:hypothetical protein